jgi:hypothetical protein
MDTISVDPFEVAMGVAEEKGRNIGRARQQALRRICLGKDGKLTKEARVIGTYLMRYCNGDGAMSSALRAPGTGAVDPLAMAQVVGRREVFDLLVRMLHVTLEERHNLKELT